MKVHKTALHGLLILEDEPLVDERGSFLELFTTKTFIDIGMESDIKMVNASQSRQVGTIRGMHWQDGSHGQTKLVRSVQGSVFDVAVDVRPDSETCGRWASIYLTPTCGKALYIPKGFAHGWQALEDGSRIMYIVGSNGWTPSSERGLRPMDPKIGIDWPLTPTAISARDASWPLFSA